MTARGSHFSNLSTTQRCVNESRQSKPACSFSSMRWSWVSKCVKCLNTFDVLNDVETSTSMESCNDFSGRVSRACNNEDTAVADDIVETNRTRQEIPLQSDKISTNVDISIDPTRNRDVMYSWAKSTCMGRRRRQPRNRWTDA
jgi:hypothetical protein